MITDTVEREADALHIGSLLVLPNSNQKIITTTSHPRGDEEPEEDVEDKQAQTCEPAHLLRRKI